MNISKLNGMTFYVSSYDEESEEEPITMTFSICDSKLEDECGLELSNDLSNDKYIKGIEKDDFEDLAKELIYIISDYGRCNEVIDELLKTGKPQYVTITNNDELIGEFIIDMKNFI